MAKPDEEANQLVGTVVSRTRGLWVKHGEKKKRQPGLGGFRAFIEESDTLARYVDFVSDRIAKTRTPLTEGLARKCAAMRWQGMLLRVRIAQDFFGDITSGRRPQAVGADTVANRELEHLQLVETFYAANGARHELKPLEPDTLDLVRRMIAQLGERSLSLPDLTDEVEAMEEAAAEREAQARVQGTERTADAAAERPKLKRSLAEMSEAEKRLARVHLPTELKGGVRFLARSALEVVTQARQRVGLTNTELARRVGLPDTALTLMIGGHDPIPQGIVERLEAVLSGLEAGAFQR